MTVDVQTILIAVGAGVAVILLLWLMLRARLGRQRLRRDRARQVGGDPYAVSKERPYMKSGPPPEPAADAIADEPVDVAPAGAFAGDIAGIAMPPGATDHEDDLTRLKGVGPKLAVLLNQEGITQFSQLGALGDDEAAALDARLGAFRGRLARDRVVEQARLLASGDRDGYEAAFGTLGGSTI